uniref:RNA-directed RNA polymerase n=1 Tax=Diaporthe helianthi totivirus 1 TaxID=3077436 RepID=A0AA96K8E4_9VIRU|nr:MAG: RNA-dependent RNA polymerase [Diaporthe helianthi totivirus 1]
MCLKYDGKTLRAVAFRDSNYIYLRTTKSPAPEGEVSYIHFGVAVRARIFEGVDYNFVYMKVDQYIVTHSKAALATITRHFNGLYDSIYWDEPTDFSSIFRDRYPDRELNNVNDTKKIEKLKNTKITSAHHIHFTPLEVDVSTTGLSKSDAEDSTRWPNDATLSMAAGMMLWYRSLKRGHRSAVKECGLLKCRTVTEFKKLAKDVSVECKSLQNLVSEDLRPLFEIDVIVNRVDGDVDWQVEKNNRTEPRLAELDYSEVYAAARAIFRQASLIGRKPMSTDWSKYWASRWQWSAAGSIHSQHIDDEAFIVRSSRELKNKFITIANMPNITMDYFTSRSPEIQGWASTKYEWGKQRAIYGTDLTSYALSNFAFYNCENVLPNRFPVGKDANDLNVVSRVTGVLRNRLPYCLDFEDFNSQHSVSSMRAVIDAYGDCFKSVLSEEQYSAIQWTSESVKTQIINDNVGLKQRYKAKGTLLSGWRLTTFVNSVLNAVYTDKLCEGVKVQGSSLHNGDDVLIGATNLEVARRCLAVGKELGIRIQPAKCAFGGIAEFLRIDHVRGSKGQYLTRAVATLVHSRIESKMSTDARDLVQSMENRFSDCRSRGMSLGVIARLRSLYYSRQAKICGNSKEEMYIIKQTHRVSGGISEEIGSTNEFEIEAGVTRKGDVIVPRLLGVDAYARQVAVSLGMESREVEMRKRLYKATYEAVVPKSRSMKIGLNSNRQWCDNVKAMYKAFKGSIDVAGYGKAALVGFALDLLTRDKPDATLVMALKRSPDPAKLIKYLV